MNLQIDTSKAKKKINKRYLQSKKFEDDIKKIFSDTFDFDENLRERNFIEGLKQYLHNGL